VFPLLAGLGIPAGLVQADLARPDSGWFVATVLGTAVGFIVGVIIALGRLIIKESGLLALVGLTAQLGGTVLHGGFGRAIVSGGIAGAMIGLAQLARCGRGLD
jgi:hypothetical protein